MGAVGVTWTAVSIAAVGLLGAPWPALFLPAALGWLRRELAAVWRPPGLRKTLRAALLSAALR